MRALTICTNEESGSHECSNNVAHVKEISIITLPSHRRRDKKSKITPLEVSQLRALNGQLLWLGMQYLPQLRVPLSLLMGQTQQAAMDTIFEVSKQARKATAWGKSTTQNPCSSSSCCGYVHRCWMDHSTRWHFTKWTVGLHCKLRVAARQRIKHVSDILAFESQQRLKQQQTAMTKLSTYVCA